MNILSCTPKILFLDKNGEKIVGDELWLFPPVLGGEKFILNNNARKIYQYCKEGKTIGKILQSFSEIYSKISPKVLLEDILKILKTFWMYQLITWDTNPFEEDYIIYQNESNSMHIEKLVYDNFETFFKSDLKNKYTNPYIAKNALNTKTLVEKQILEGSIVGYVLYINESIKVKVLLRFDRFNRIADILLLDFDNSIISKDNLNVFLTEIGKNILLLWDVTENQITFTFPINTKIEETIKETLEIMGFENNGILKEECKIGSVFLFSKLLAL